MNESNRLTASNEVSGTAPLSEAQQQPLGYKEMIEQAYTLAKTAQTNTLRFTVILEDILTQIEQLQITTSDIKKQLASIYKLSETNTPLTAENVSKYIVTRESEALRQSLSDLVAANALQIIDKIEKDTDIVAYKTKDVTFGYMSLFAFSAEDQSILKGKAAGETVGQYVIEEVYREVPKTDNTSADSAALDIKPQSAEDTAPSSN